MSRRRPSPVETMADDLLKILIHVPVWVGPIVAAVAYLVFRYLVPAMMPSDPIGGMFRAFVRGAAIVAPMFMGMVWLASLVVRWKRGKLLDSRDSMASLRSMSWQDFEHLVGEAYRRQGYFVEETGGGGSDGGVDLILGRDGEKVVVQCKQWRSWTVGVRVVRELFGTMMHEGADTAVVVTCGRFTRDAEDFADGKPIELVDGPALWELVKSVQVDAVPAPKLPQPSAPTAAPPTVGAVALSCPECGSPMVLKTARNGWYAGRDFYSCCRFPDCKGKRNIADPT